MKKALIGISLSLAIGRKLNTSFLENSVVKDSSNYFYLNDKYIEPLRKSGCMPIFLPLYKDEDLLDKLDGVIIPGGDDIHPDFFEQREVFKGTYELYEKVDFDFWLIRKCYEKNIPLVGVCYGMQAINVSFGGSLYQDLSFVENENMLNHGKSNYPNIHEVEINDKCILKEIYNENQIEVVSIHHQAIYELGLGLEIIAKSSDGIIEAIEHEKALIFGVQWHPEELIIKNNESEYDLRFWQYFGDLCLKNKK